MTPLLEIRDLDLYYGDAQALDGVSLTVDQGSIVAIVGANGAGKSSLIRSIAGIETTSKGEIFFAGRPIRGLAAHRICELGIGQVAEGRQLFPTLTTLENLQMGGLLPRARSRTKEKLAEVFALFPRLFERAKQPAGTLSGGEQQMLAIGRCLMACPKLIMLDEPSLGLAPIIAQQMMRAVQELNRQGMTILWVEQNIALSLTLAQQAYVLENGRVVLAGSGCALLDDDRVRRSYLGL